MKTLAVFLWFATALASFADTPFVSTPAGEAAAPRNFRALYHFGWAALDAADADFSITTGKRIAFKGKVATTGVVRSLFKLDATMDAVLHPVSLLPETSRIIEKYRKEEDTTELTFHDSSVLRRRIEKPDRPRPAEKTFELSRATDLFGAVMNIRSQRLQPGDVYPLLVFSKAAPYRAIVTVEQKESITVPAGTFPAIRVSLQLRKLDRKGRLLETKNFKSAAAWFSADASRHLLRIKAEVMVGSVWAELAEVR